MCIVLSEESRIIYMLGSGCSNVGLTRGITVEARMRDSPKRDLFVDDEQPNEPGSFLAGSCYEPGSSSAGHVTQEKRVASIAEAINARCIVNHITNL